jgi:tetratricopeptide (TPR) repeat protein
VVLGSLWGDAGASPERRRTRTELEERSAWSAHALASGLVGLATVSAVVWGTQDVEADRDGVFDAFERTNLASAAEVGSLKGAIRAAISRHPADYYFPLLGAMLAWRSGAESPIAWLERTLERSPINGRAHMLLAEVLNVRGAKRQSLFELRLAAEYDVSMLGPAAAYAVRWAGDFDELELAVPAGPMGASTLDEMGARLRAPERRELLARVDAECIARDATMVGPRLREVDVRVAAMRDPASPLCRDAGACAREIEEHAHAVDAAHPDSSLGATFRARALAATGRLVEAIRILDTACAMPDGRASCLELRAGLALGLGDPERIATAVKEYLSSACTSTQACAAAQSWVGDQRAARGDWSGAAAAYERAARDDPTEERWRKAADTASRAGMHGQAVHDLERIAQRRGGADPELDRRIHEEKAAAAAGLLP